MSPFHIRDPMPSEPSTKKQFVAPSLIVYGDVRRVTATVNPLKTGDNAGGNGSKS